MKLKCMFIFVLLLLIVTACEDKELSPIEYMRWIEKNKTELQNEKTIGDLTYQVRYNPVEYMVLQITGAHDTLKETEFNYYLQEKQGLQYYTFRIGIPESEVDILNYKIKDNSEYNKRMEYFAFMVKDDIKLVDGLDTFPCVLHHFERYYGHAPFITLDLGFENDPENLVNTRKIIYNDLVFGNGRIILEINENKIKNIPNIKL